MCDKPGIRAGFHTGALSADRPWVQIKAVVARWYWKKWLRFYGRVANLAGLPGFVRECDYYSESLGVAVRVRMNPGFTVSTVDGVDVYFYRLSGYIDGVGLNSLG